MKVLVTILILILFTVYVGFFLKSTVIYYDLGSTNTKIVTYIAGIKSTEIKENNISRFLSIHGIKFPELWTNVHYYKGGLFKERLITDGTLRNLDMIISFVNGWLDIKLNVDKASESEIETVVKPLIIKFIECLQKDDQKGITEITEIIMEDKSKELDKRIEKRKQTKD